MQGLGKCVPGVTGLLYVEGHVDRLWLASPLAVHLPACELFFQPVLVDPQEIGRKSQNYTKQNKNMTIFQIFNNSSHKYMTCVCTHARYQPPLASKIFHCNEDGISEILHTSIHFNFSQFFYYMSQFLWWPRLSIIQISDPRRVANQSPLLRSQPNAWKGHLSKSAARQPGRN